MKFKENFMFFMYGLCIVALGIQGLSHHIVCQLEKIGAIHWAK